MNEPYHFLLVDDNPDDRELAIRALRREFPNLRATEVIDQAGLDRALAAGGLDLVITDYRLHWTNGLIVLRAVKAHWPRCPVVMFTATGNEEIAVAAMKEDLADYVLKSPQHYARLAVAVRGALERVQERKARQEAEARYQTLAEISPVGIFRTDAEGVTTYVNPRWCEIAGLPASEALGDGWLCAVHPDDRERIAGGWDGAVHEQHLSTAGYRFLRPDGTIAWVMGQAVPETNEAGRIVGYVGTITDITERQRMEAALQELNTTLETRVQQRTFDLQILYELSQQLGYVLNYGELLRLMLEHLHRAVPYDVAAGLLMTGERGELLIQPTRLLAPAVQRVLEERLVSTFNRMSGQSVSLEQLNPRFMAATAFDEEAPPVGHLGSDFQVALLAGEDLATVGLVYVGAEPEQAFTEDHVRLLYTVANQAAASIERLRALLAAEQQRLASLVENLPEGVMHLNDQHRILLVNPAARDYLTVLAPAYPAPPLRDLGGWPIATLLAPPPPGMLHHEIAVGSPRQRVFEVAARRMIAETEARGWVVVIREVTAEREMQQQVQQQDRLAAVGQLAAGIAHDFNNILTGMIGLAQLWQMDPQIPARAKEDLGLIAQEGLRAAHLIRQMLDFSRRSAPSTTPLDLASLVNEMVEFLERVIPEHVRVDLEIQPGDYMVNADPGGIQQAVTNLAVNARDAMPAGGELRLHLSELTLSLAARPPVPEMSPGQWVVLAVADTGTGVPPEVLPHLFEPFFTTKAPGAGTGLGLAQVFGIVKQHGGHIAVETEVGRGTTFRIYLPHHAGQEPRAPKMDAILLPQGQGETILLAEDQETVRQMGQRLLEALGYRVLVATNGREALDLYRSAERVDLVLTDLVMPEMGGLELIRQLREIAPDLRILVTTGYEVAEDLAELSSAGVHSV
ncbi:MAG: response regulator, partial [Chloroflexi bacterium]|nr:response regulator [Chloroflexota bacterium]